MRRIPHRIWLAVAASGMAALVYQMGWLRLLTFSMGATWPAITVVLAGFMAGLGVGAHLGGVLADRVSPRGLVAAYVGVELAILVTGAGVALLTPTLALLPFPGIGVLTGRALVAGCMVAVPAVAIGATAPILAVFCGRLLASRSSDAVEHGAYVPVLYAVNAAGAVAGALAGGLWLPYEIGVPGALGVAGALNAVAALCVGTVRPAVETAGSPTREPEPAAEEAGGVTTLAVLCFGSGFLSLAAETVWTRSLAQIDAELYTGRWLQPGDVLSVVLAQVLVGQAIGGALAASQAVRRAGTASLLRWLGVVLVIGGVLSLGALEIVSVLLTRTQGAHEAPSWGLALRLALVLPAGIAFGTTFPILGALVARSRALLGRRLGGLWAVNTAGTVLGSVLAGAVVLPYLGSARGVVGAGLLAVVLGALAIRGASRLSPPGPRTRALDVGLVVAAVVVLAVVSFAAPLRPGRALALKHGEDVIVATWEGWEATTVVAQPPASPRGIVTNGHMILGNVPYISRAEDLRRLHGSASDALLVGFGTGNFARSLLRRGGIGDLTIVEIDGFQFRAAELFGTKSVITDRRVTTVVDDALHYLATTDRTWDLIAVDAWGPDRSPTLYTTEMHERARDHLAPDGLYWAKLVQTTPESERALRDAARCTWPHAWLHPPPDIALVASLVDREMPSHLRKLPPADESCQPLSRLHPVRIRALQPPRTRTAVGQPQRTPPTATPARSAFPSTSGTSTRP